MHSRLMITGAVGLALALTLGGSNVAAQQTDTSRVMQDTSANRASTQRIPVRKDANTTTESTGAIVPRDTTSAMPQPDTSSAIRQDTTTARPDTTTVTPTPPVATTDTTTLSTVSEEPALGPIPGGWFFGLGGGASVPSGDFNDAFNTGWNATATLGWRPVNSIWGIRLDGSYNRMSADEASGLSSNDQATIWSGMLDLTLDFPIGQNGTSFYLLGGGGVHHMAMDFEGVDDDVSINDSNTDFGLNGGAGVNFALGRTNLFIEGRFVNVFNGQNGASDTRYIPVTAGLKWFF